MERNSLEIGLLNFDRGVETRRGGGKGSLLANTWSLGALAHLQAEREGGAWGPVTPGATVNFQ